VSRSAPIETEVKLRLADPAPVRSALARLGAERKRERHFEDNVLFDDATGALRASSSLLRLRTTEAGGTLTFKGPRSVREGLKSRLELESAVAAPAMVCAILEALGFRARFRYQKFREVWTLLGQEVVVDETPIGTFLEIEGEAAGIHEVARALGFSPADYVSDSYVSLFVSGGGKGDMVFP
jgi:adenylate cyclase, class 2